MNYLLYFVIINLNLSAFALLATTEGAANPKSSEKGRIHMKNNNTSEEWRTISFSPNYAVSNLGRVKRLTDKTNTYANRILKPVDDGIGYLCVSLKIQAKNKWQIFRVHRLVAATFLGEPERDFVVNHKNGVRSDNRLENLEYTTQAGNVQHAYEMGFQSREQNCGENNGQAKLNESQVIEIYNRRGNKQSARSLAQEYKISDRAILEIWDEITWKETTKQIRNVPPRPKSIVEIVRAALSILNLDASSELSGNYSEIIECVKTTNNLTLQPRQISNALVRIRQSQNIKLRFRR
jgi:hypothetical protein